MSMARTPARSAKVTLQRHGTLCVIPVPFDPRAVFGKVRAPVRVTLNGYTYRSTIFAMGGVVGIPLRKSHRDAAGVEGNETLTVKIALDTAERSVEIPAELARAFRGNRAAAARWDTLSYTHRREYAEAISGAKKPETRARRVASTLRALATKAK
ncbi:MAG TPA: YdeI/OmpD-associated family protein [Steroidobacteraceae bacterium]|nr:YdeI/OmpD-associated family protein [Steroidobacteraceae bacterium]